MAKIAWKPGTMLSPLPPVLVSCGTVDKPNVLTIAWTGIIASDPVMTYVSIRPQRHSHGIIKESGEFVINLPNLPLIEAVDFCGVKSGKDNDKFKAMNLTVGECVEVKAPQIIEAPVSLECKVKSVTNYGSHDMFLAEVVAVNIDDKYLDDKGKLCLEKAGLIAFSHGKYFTLGRELGTMGFSVNKRRLAEIEKMKNIEVVVKHSKATDENRTGEKPVKSSAPKKDSKYGKPKPRAEGLERRLSEKSRRPREDSDDRGERKPRPFSDKPRGDRKFDDKPRRPRDGGDDRGERKPRSFGDKPRGDRKFDDKPRRPRDGGDDRGERKPRPFGDKPRGDRKFDDKPRRPRDGGDDRGERKPRPFGDKPRGGRKFDDKPRRSR